MLLFSHDVPISMLAIVCQGPVCGLEHSMGTKKGTNAKNTHVYNRKKTRFPIGKKLLAKAVKKSAGSRLQNSINCKSQKGPKFVAKVN